VPRQTAAPGAVDEGDLVHVIDQDDEMRHTDPGEHSLSFAGGESQAGTAAAARPARGAAPLAPTRRRGAVGAGIGLEIHLTGCADT